MPEADGYYTADEIARASLGRLGDTVASADAMDIARSAYLGLHDEMQENGHADWPSAMCPLRARNGVTQIVAGRIAHQVTGEDAVSAAARESAGWRAYFAANARPASAGPAQATYF